MVAAVDSSILLDVFSGRPPFFESSAEALRNALRSGSLIACEIVWAEVRASFSSDSEFDKAMRKLQVRFVPISQEAAVQAGVAWRQYRRRGGKRRHLIPDFLVAAHAQVHANLLLTRDRGFSRDYFKGLRIAPGSSSQA